GYTGPVSYPKARLLEVLAQHGEPDPMPDAETVEVDSFGVHPTNEPATAPRRNRRGRRIAPPRPSRFVKVTEWDGLDANTEFRVKGESGWFRFIAHVTNPETGATWLDAHGGAGKHLQFRSFHEDRLVVRR